MKFEADNLFFNIKDTLLCGQVFRFKPYKDGYLVFSLDKCAYCYDTPESAVIECNDGDEEYFWNYFDLDRDYTEICESALNSKYEILQTAVKLGKGIRILNQDCLEATFSFIVSQNNNIPRIKGIIEKLCLNLGEKKRFKDVEFYAFPSVEKMAEKDAKFYHDLGLGYRAEYIQGFAKDIVNGYNLEGLKILPTEKLKEELLKIKGIGPKVCDCASFFGFHRSDSFPVDTWIEKVYYENFNGQIKGNKKIAEWFVNEFKGNSGYFQQYLFYYKRSKENK